MSLASFIAVLSLASSPTPDSISTALAAQSEPRASTAQDPSRPVQLEDIQVTGRHLTDLVNRFVNEVAEPNRGRGFARWDGEVCVGVTNLQNETAQYLVDRISTVADDLGLRVGGEGCKPNLTVMMTSDGKALARSLVSQHRGALRTGASGADRGLSALADFWRSDRPVRWWQVSMPTSISGHRAARLPGDCNPPEQCAGRTGDTLAYAPQIRVFAASRLRSQIFDNITNTIVIVDVDEISGMSAQQLADYIAMVSFAQINPTADTSAYPSILNVFDDPAAAQSLTSWDMAYLQGLYSAERHDVSRIAGRGEIRDLVLRAHGGLTEAQEPRH